MYPGPNDTEARRVEHDYRLMLAEARLRRSVAVEPSAEDNHFPGLAAIRQRLGRLLIQTGQRLEGAHRASHANSMISSPDHIGDAR